MDNSSFSKENLKDFQTELSISEKGRTFLINASHGIYLRWLSSPTSLKSLIYKELKTRGSNKTMLFYYVITLSNQIVQNT